MWRYSSLNLKCLYLFCIKDDNKPISPSSKVAGTSNNKLVKSKSTNCLSQIPRRGKQNKHVYLHVFVTCLKHWWDPDLRASLHSHNVLFYFCRCRRLRLIKHALSWNMWKHELFLYAISFFLPLIFNIFFFL